MLFRSTLEDSEGDDDSEMLAVLERELVSEGEAPMESVAVTEPEILMGGVLVAELLRLLLPVIEGDSEGEFGGDTLGVFEGEFGGDTLGVSEPEQATKN